MKRHIGFSWNNIQPHSKRHRMNLKKHENGMVQQFKKDNNSMRHY